MNKSMKKSIKERIGSNKFENVTVNNLLVFLWSAIGNNLIREHDGKFTHDRLLLLVATILSRLPYQGTIVPTPQRIPGELLVIRRKSPIHFRGGCRGRARRNLKNRPVFREVRRDNKQSKAMLERWRAGGGGGWQRGNARMSLLFGT